MLSIISKRQGTYFGSCLLMVYLLCLLCKQLLQDIIKRTLYIIAVWHCDPLRPCLFVGRGRQGRSGSGVSVGIPGPGFGCSALRLYSVIRDKDIVERAHRQQGRCWVSCPPDLTHAVLLRTFHWMVPIRISSQESRLPPFRFLKRLIQMFSHLYLITHRLI